MCGGLLVFGNPPLTATESNPVALEISFMRLDSYGYVFTKINHVADTFPGTIS